MHILDICRAALVHIPSGVDIRLQVTGLKRGRPTVVDVDQIRCRRGEFVPVAFVDDNPALRGAVINGLEVHSPASLPSFIEEFGVSRVLLALPSVSRRRRLEIINQLEQLPVHVQTMPDTGDLVSGNSRVDDIREVDITDLLGRDPVPPIAKLLDLGLQELRLRHPELEVHLIQPDPVPSPLRGSSMGFEASRAALRFGYTSVKDYLRGEAAAPLRRRFGIRAA